MIMSQALLIITITYAASKILVIDAFLPYPQTSLNSVVYPKLDGSFESITALQAKRDTLDDKRRDLVSNVSKGFSSVFLGLALTFNTIGGPLQTVAPANAADGAKIGYCLLNKCKVPLAKCITNPKRLANVICINTCNSAADEIGCQIKCGDTFENDIVGEFNKCAVSDMDCVPTRLDDGSYPVPKPEVVVPKFDTKLWNGRWYITAGQNDLFDIFPCQIHFFTETAPGKFFGKLNWRIEEPDGEFFSRDAAQRFVQDPKQPAHLINHDNEYLHYQDDWWILDYAEDDNKEGVPPFAFVYYRGANDAWIGYGGVVVYTREAKMPPELIPRLREAAKKVNYDFDKDFTLTDNTCKTITADEVTLLREKFAGKVIVSSEKQVQALSTKARNNSVNSIKAQKLFFAGETTEATKAFQELQQSIKAFESDFGAKTP